ncbi:mismatch repair endonuclease PMS2 isoform X1 [Hyalella azteca]|uniref:Mismatch repair endonuclease PMS2 isoform X1 n=1 Tax=Hyalella azteca TaxID=294128 RepID=A0A8B7PF38_HYAAZ|nr:mismatch repair endonuclease PMS2 isoform X2 [Hyalella azteca]XP_047738686.1 mismatch repair endonuclease PMS2 isoform X1 [Hyalella azteca]
MSVLTSVSSFQVCTANPQTYLTFVSTSPLELSKNVLPRGFSPMDIPPEFCCISSENGSSPSSSPNEQQPETIAAKPSLHINGLEETFASEHGRRSVRRRTWSGVEFVPRQETQDSSSLGNEGFSGLSPRATDCGRTRIGGKDDPERTAGLSPRWQRCKVRDNGLFRCKAGNQTIPSTNRMESADAIPSLCTREIGSSEPEGKENASLGDGTSYESNYDGLKIPTVSRLLSKFSERAKGVHVSSATGGDVSTGQFSTKLQLPLTSLPRGRGRTSNGTFELLQGSDQFKCRVFEQRPSLKRKRSPSGEIKRPVQEFRQSVSNEIKIVGSKPLSSHGELTSRAPTGATKAFDGQISTPGSRSCASPLAKHSRSRSSSPSNAESSLPGTGLLSATTGPSGSPTSSNDGPTSGLEETIAGDTNAAYQFPGKSSTPIVGQSPTTSSERTSSCIAGSPRKSRSSPTPNEEQALLASGSTPSPRSSSASGEATTARVSAYIRARRGGGTAGAGSTSLLAKQWSVSSSAPNVASGPGEGQRQGEATPTLVTAKHIQAIDRAAVHRICSGQVVVNLATAVKELVENSLDAGSRSVEVKLTASGASSVVVSDDGPGIHPNDFEALALKHHTSKLRDFEGVCGIATYGFRGEALSSLCALSRFSVCTRHASQPLASLLTYDADGKLTSQKAASRQVGTTVSLESLFYSLPVRRREFERNLKREYHKMLQVLYAYAIISKNIRLHVVNNSDGRRNTVLATHASYCLLDNIQALFGSKQVKTLLEIQGSVDSMSDEEESEEPTEAATGGAGMRVEGFISSCAHGHGRAAPDRQFYFINNRPCDPIKVSRLVNEVYHSYNRHQYPFVVLNVVVQRACVDVNVTPDKRQVMMHNEKLLLITLKNSLLRLYEGIPHTLPLNFTTSSPLTPVIRDTPYTQSKRTQDMNESSFPSPEIKPMEIEHKLPKPFSDICGDAIVTPTKFSHMDPNVPSNERAKTKSTENGEGDITDTKPRDAQLTRTTHTDAAKHSPSQTLARRLQASKKPTAFAVATAVVLDKGNDGSSNKTTRIASPENNVIREGENDDELDSFGLNIQGSHLKKCLETLNKTQTQSAQMRAISHISRSSDLEDGTSTPSHMSAVESIHLKSIHTDNKSEQIYRTKISPCRYKPLTNNSCDDLANILEGNSTGAKSKCSRLHLKVDTGKEIDEKNREEITSALQQITETESLVYSSGKARVNHVLANNMLDRRVSRKNPQTLERENAVETANVDVRKSLRKFVHKPESEDRFSDAQTTEHHISKVPLSSQHLLTPDTGILPADDTSFPGVELESTVIYDDHVLDVTKRKTRVIQFSMDDLRVQLTKVSAVEKADAEKKKARNFHAKIAPSDNKAAEAELTKVLNKDMFAKMKILGQFNLGFLITRLDSDLFIIDQHASDEKYNFETLQATCILRHQPLIQPQALQLTPANETILISNIDIFSANGFKFEIDESRQFGERVKLKSVPQSRNWTFGKDDIDELIFMLSDSHGAMCRPSRVRAMFASRACRKSIMVGTALSKNQMRDLVDHMGQIEQPWNCPHGRPTVRHLINLDMLSVSKL